MNYTKTTILSLLTVTVFAFSGCKKEDAPKKKSGSVVFWQTQSTADAAQTAGITTYYIYVAGELAGSMGSAQYWNVGPTCGAAGAVTFNMDLGSENERTVAVVIKDQDQDEIVAGTVTLKSDVCLSEEL